MSNARMLGIYYATQKVLLDNLAGPMGHGLKSLLGVVDADDGQLLAGKTAKYLRPGISQEKLSQVMTNLLTGIDSGSIKPQTMLGHQFTLEQTIDQFELHDSFMKVYDTFFATVSEKGVDEKLTRQKVAGALAQFKLSREEEASLGKLFTGSAPRSPLTLQVDELRNIVDCMYEEVCTVIGPAEADRCLSNSIKQAQSSVPTYNSQVFL